MFEFEVQSLRHWRLRLGGRHFRTWRPRFMNLPRGYRTPETIYEVVRVDEETDSVAHGLGAFDSELEAQRLIDELETEGGYGKLAVNRIPVHARLSDWQFDR